MAQLRIRATGAFCLSEPGGAKIDQQPAQVEDTPFWRGMIRQGLAEEVPVGDFLAEARKRAKAERNKMANVDEDKGIG
jgi:hypothetical protein